MANNEEPRNPEEESGGPEEEGLSQDPYVEKVRPDPSEPPLQVRVLQGLMGNSDREGYKRLYFSRELDSYAEFRQEDVLYSEPIPPVQPPFVGLDATRVGIRRDAAIEYTRVRAPRPVDEFDLDVRLGDAPSRRPATTDNTCFGGTCEGTCFGGTCEGTCAGLTCEGTCAGNTCEGTCFNDNTCFGTCNVAETCPPPCFLPPR